MLLQSVDKSDRLSNGFSRRQIAGCISPRALDLTILPTEKCNFRCTYCYEDFELGRMPRAVREGVINLIRRRAESIEFLNISWFGGEPLLAEAVIFEIAREAHALSQEYGFKIQGGMSTNAYRLDAKLLSELCALGQDFYQITLDGWGAGHDRTRRRADGAGTFDRIWENLLSFRPLKCGFEVCFRIHHTHENFDSLRTLCTEIRESFGSDPRFRVDFQDIRALGGPGAATIVGLSSRDFNAQKTELRRILAGSETSAAPVPEIAPRFPVGESATGRRAYMDEGEVPYICYAAKPNHFLIRANGRVGKCTVALADPVNDIGFITPDGRLVIDEDKHMPWIEGLETLSQERLACPLHTIQEVIDRRRAIPVQVIDGVISDRFLSKGAANG